MLIKATDMLSFIAGCRSGQIGDFDEIIAPVQSRFNNHLNLKRLTSEEKIYLDGYRTADPAKIFFYLFREHVNRKVFPKTKRLIAGLKACDVKALKLMDKALINDSFVDPLYKSWRENTFIIATDCTDFAESCHCTTMHGEPYAESGFDLNLSLLEDQYFIKSDSEKGEKLFGLLKQHYNLYPVQTDTLSKVKITRHRMHDFIDRNQPTNGQDTFSKLTKVEMQKWSDKSKSCIGCGACTNICPTCYCLILNDESDKKDFVKVRSYDSCQLNGYARVAGGATPRGEMTKRFRNRYLCKLCYMQNNFDTLGCVGCGRCIDACPAGIDYNRVVKELAGIKPEPVKKPELVEA